MICCSTCAWVSSSGASKVGMVQDYSPVDGSGGGPAEPALAHRPDATGDGLGIRERTSADGAAARPAAVLDGGPAGVGQQELQHVVAPPAVGGGADGLAAPRLTEAVAGVHEDRAAPAASGGAPDADHDDASAGEGDGVGALGDGTEVERSGERVASVGDTEGAFGGALEAQVVEALVDEGAGVLAAGRF